MLLKNLLLVLAGISPLLADVTLRGAGITMRVDASLQTELTGVTPLSPSETITVGGKEVTRFAFQSHRSRKISGKLGPGREHLLIGEASAEHLRKELTVKVYDAFPGVLTVQVKYTNTGSTGIQVSGWTNHRYALPASGAGEPAFWSFQSGSYESRPSWVLPLKPGFQQANFQGMNDIDYGGGTPVSDVWRRDVGLAVGHLDLRPRRVSLPVAMPDARHAELRVEFKVDRKLEPGESLETLPTFAAVHQGDYFSVLVNYRKMMIAQGIRMPESPSSAFDPIWCAWGFRRNFQPSQIYSALPIVKSLGFRWVTLDDGWQTAEGDWYPVKTKFPAGDRDMKAMVDHIHREGFKAQLWWAPMSVDPGTDLIKQHPEWLLLDADGKPHKITYWDAYYLCPAVPEVRRNAAELVSKFIREWGYDGLKLDGQFLNAAPQCHNPAHKHASPDESGEAVPSFFKAIFEAATAAKRDAVVEFCPCGTSYSFFTLPYQNMAVASDPTSSYQIRSKGKTLKALMGDRIAYFGDHVELSDGHADFASSVGIGAVVGTEFTWPLGSGPARKDGSRPSDLTPAREQVWSKWIDIYKSKMLPKGEYLGGLYDIGFDLPETHAIRKDGKMYYAFYAPQFGGEVSFRGLGKGQYRLRDYENGRDLGTVTGPVAKLPVQFAKHLLVEAIPQ